MTEKELKKLNRAELLEIMLAQQTELEKLQAELAEARAELENREIKLRELGSIAEASIGLTDVFTEAQKAADLYLQNVYRVSHLYLRQQTGIGSMQEIAAEIEKGSQEVRDEDQPE